MEREVIFRWRRLTRHRPVITPALLLLLAVAACSTVAEPCSCVTSADTQLSLPNVSRVSALDGILASEIDQASVQGVAAYTGSAVPVGNTAALLDIHSTLYVFDVTTQSLQPVSGSGLLCPGFALNPVDRSVICVSGDEQSTHNCYVPCTGTSLELVTLSADWPPVAHVEQQVVASSEEHATFSSPTWSPDGRHLAVIESRPATEVALFAHGNGATPLAVSGFVQLSTSLDQVYQVAWSPDGNYLALIYAPAGGRSVQAGVIPVSALPAAALSGAANPPTVTIVPQALASVSSGPLLAWTPDSRSLTIGEGTLAPQYPQAQQFFEQVAVPSGVVSTPFLRFPVGRRVGIGVFAWMADGRTLLFSYGEFEYARSSAQIPSVLAAVRAPSACACLPPPAVVYQYTSP